MSKQEMQEFEKDMESNTVELDYCWNEIKERKKLAQLVNDVLSILVWGSSKLMTTWQLKQVMTKK